MQELVLSYKTRDFHVIRNTGLVFRHIYKDTSRIVGVDLQRTMSAIDSALSN